MKTALVHFSPLPPLPCMSLVLFNMRVKSRRHQVGPQDIEDGFHFAPRKLSARLS
jgi:hypothetical protein